MLTKDVPEHVIDDLLEIRKSGKYNMLDAKNVVAELLETEKYASFNWLFIGLRADQTAEVDREKYSASLTALGEVLSLADILTKE